MDDPKDDSSETRSSKSDDGPEVGDESTADDRARREDQVRRKLQQMFGDDSPETVRHFLSDLARDDVEADLPSPSAADDLVDSEPN